MTRTPWGDAANLRSRMLRPGFRLPPEAVARNQRWRLLAAMVAAVSERGYEATTVAHVIGLSGVSRKAFYKHFANKEECFLAAVDATVELAMSTVSHAYHGEGDWEQRLRAAFDAFLADVVAQPAAARMCFLDVYVAGPAAVDHAERAATALERVVRESFEHSPERAGMPQPVVRAIVGGVRKVIYTRLRRDEEDQLPSLAPGLTEWALSFHTPPEPIKRPRTRAARRPAPAPADDQTTAERICAAVAAITTEKGYAAMTLDDVAAEAATSFSTFYNHFDTKEDAFLATYQMGIAQAFEVAIPSFHREPDWAHGVRSALAALLDFLSTDVRWAHVGVLEVLAAGPRGMERRDDTIDSFAELLRAGSSNGAAKAMAAAPPVAAEAVCGAIFTLVYDQIRRHGAERLPEIHPTATFVALAPFLGAGRALAVANEPLSRARRAGTSRKAS